jgi:hypothetical protein
MRISLLRSPVMLAVGVAMSLFAACGPAGAFTLSPEYLPAAPADQLSIAVYREGVEAPKVEHVWCRWGCRGWGWRGGGWHGGWGWGGPAVVGGLAAAGPYWGGPYYGGCWRRVWGYYGWRWVRFC